jgi:GNAT superfamily N-acetyltransferase
MHDVHIRLAHLDDVPDIVGVLRDSITELCDLDHQGDRETLALWLKNKTVPNVSNWMSDPSQNMFVAQIETEIAGVGLVHEGGEIRLCYISPGWIGTGSGRLLLEAMENQARNWGLDSVFLSSTNKARTFYEHHGYQPGLCTKPGFGLSICYGYEKSLV